MMKKTSISLLILILATVFINAQKPALDNSVYDGWKSLRSQVITDDGKWVSYEINPQQGDGYLYIFNTATGQKDSVARGEKASFASDSKYIVYQIEPSYAETRQAKKKKLKDDKLPKSDLGIRVLSDGAEIIVPRVKSFSLPEKNSFWMAYLLEKKIPEKKNEKADSDTTNAKSESAKKDKTPEPKGSDFIIYNPLTKKEFVFPDVTEYVVAKDGKSISYLQNIPDTGKIENFRLNVFDPKKESSSVIFEGSGSVKKLSTDRTGDLVSFIYSADTAKVKVYELWLSKNMGNSTKIVTTSNQSLPKGWTASENGDISFSDDGTRLFFGTAVKPVKEPEDTLLDDEKFKLDIWSWDDDLLQPMQKKQLAQEKKRTYMAVYHTNSGKIFQLEDTVIISVRTYQKGNSDFALGSSDLEYRKSSSWEGRSHSDYYLINVSTGTKTLILEKCASRAMLSPTGKYLLYWDIDNSAWTSIALPEGKPKNITASISSPLSDELNDAPDDPSPYGIAGWVDDEKHLLIYDRYDIWMVDLDGSENAVNLSNGYGRNNNITLRYEKLDSEADFIGRKEKLYLTAFNNISKEAGFYTLNTIKQAQPSLIVMDKASFPGSLIKAKNADLLLWQKGSYVSYPELFISKMNLENAKKLSVTNPQQADYNWGTTELFEWMSFDHQKLQGILYKPEDFDPSKKYPMIVYFYERSSDGLYNYMPPAPSASIINRTFAVSNDYLVFVPDIPYKIGYPGQSCYNSVVSGTYALLEKFSFIDPDRLGLDGQSWGGYQIAYLVTQTDLFKCAYAGAIVSNMISAYGGIRWGSGMSRMFQYEHTQSRIGGTLWDKPLHFIENSPIFYVPKINTPLLLMHNDADGAVPWYQGIEFINALRRLEKPAWLLSYNDEDHNLVRRANRKDISIRKMQFYDHYLKGEPMPYWMKYGISQIEKGSIDGYELVKD